MAKRFTLGKSERLKSRKSIEQLFRSGKSFTHLPFRVTYQAATEGLQFGVGVSARHFKKATDRNRIKRMTREAYRLQKNLLQELLAANSKGLHVFFNYISKEKSGYAIIAAAVEKSLTKLVNIIK
jgi:ribonuclease P protein component